MKYVIIEDEKIAAERLKKLVTQIKPTYQCLSILDSVESAVNAFSGLDPDLIFMDVQLADGLSFEILDQVSIETPIIFTTAYDTYAIRAFKSNSIDYLLKPLDQGELAIAISKFEKQHVTVPANVEKLFRSFRPQGKERFVIKVGEHLKTIKTENIQLFYSQDKATYLFTDDKRRFPIDYTMDKVGELVSSDQFFRISRKFLVKLDAIRDIVAYTNSRLQIVVDGFDLEQIIVAREKVTDFRQWLDR